MDRHQLNETYKKLDNKAHEISKLLRCPVGYYNGHYNKGESGNYEKDYFPIPEVTIKGLCDIEIGLEQISVSTKLSRDKALWYEYDRIKMYRFEVYGVVNYLEDFYSEGSTVETLIENVKKSTEENIGFSFYFPFEVSADTVCKFTEFLQKEGFFY